MPELPEIKSMALQLNSEIAGKEISRLYCSNEKCLNMSLADMQDHLYSRSITSVSSRGKWMSADLSDGARLLISLGMGGYLIFHGKGEDPRPGHRILLGFSDGTSVSVSFWWFGYFHCTGPGQTHPMVDSLGLEPLTEQFTLQAFKKLIRNSRSEIKLLLLNQKKICGIGNFYIQDLLWLAKIHPKENCSGLSEARIEELYTVITGYLGHAFGLRGASYELDIYGNPGGYGSPECGYREGEPCPRCGEKIIKIKTGSTSSFLCPGCQPFNNTSN